MMAYISYLLLHSKRISFSAFGYHTVSPAPDVIADLMNGNFPTLQQLTLIIQDILIQNIHTDGSMAKSLTCVRNA